MFTSCKHTSAVEKEREETIKLAKDNDLLGIWRDKEGVLQLTMQVQRVDKYYNIGDSGEPYDKLIINNNVDVIFEKRNDTLTIINNNYQTAGYYYYYLNGKMFAKTNRKNPTVWVWEEVFKSKQ